MLINGVENEREVRLIKSTMASLKKVFKGAVIIVSNLKYLSYKLYIITFAFISTLKQCTKELYSDSAEQLWLLTGVVTLIIISKLTRPPEIPYFYFRLRQKIIPRK